MPDPYDSASQIMEMILLTTRRIAVSSAVYQVPRYEWPTLANQPEPISILLLIIFLLSRAIRRRAHRDWGLSP